MQIIWIILGIVGGGVIVYRFLNKGGKKDDQKDSGLNLILTQINELSRTVDNKMASTQKEVSEGLKFHSSESNKIIRDVTERLTRLDETNKQVISFADQLQSLENILKNPKQ